MNPNLEGTMIEFWNSCEGQSAGSYLLEKHLEGFDNNAVYAAVSRQDARPVAVKLLQVDGVEREQRLNAWSALPPLSHPHLIKVFEVGECEIDGVSLLYLAMERADTDLASVLTERALTATEARELLDPALQALTYLHHRGFVHGGLKPSRILAVGEELKLSSDCITLSGPAPDRSEREEGAATPEGDVWSLGVTLVHALTQSSPEPDPGGADPAIPADVPEPFLTIARNCLRQDPKDRWNLAQIASHLHGPEVVSLPTPLPARLEDPRPRISFYWFLAAGLALSAILILSFRDRKASPVIPPPAPVAASPSVAPVPEPPKPAPLSSKAASDSGNWFVVVATYARKEDAERRARAIERQSPPLKARVYSPARSAKPYYLVVIGSNLSKQGANDLRTRAGRVATGAYITTFTP